MEVSPWICKELGRLDSGFRLAWAGRPRKEPNELNAGGYALVSLARRQDIGDVENPAIPNELWEVTMRPDKFGRPSTVHIDRGPIFTRSGRPGRDWDPITHIPVFVASLEDYGISGWGVNAGAVLPLVRKWQRSLRKRVMESAEAKGRDLVRAKDDLAREAHRKLMYEANKPSATRQEIAWKHAKKDVEEFYRRKEANEGLENYYNPYKDMRKY